MALNISLCNLDYVVSILYMYEDYNKCVPKEIGIVSLDYAITGHWIVKSIGQYLDLPSTIKFANDTQNIVMEFIGQMEVSNLKR